MLISIRFAFITNIKPSLEKYIMLHFILGGSTIVLLDQFKMNFPLNYQLITSIKDGVDLID